MTVTISHKLPLIVLFTALLLAPLVAADHLDIQLTTAKGEAISMRVPLASQADVADTLYEEEESFRTGIAEYYSDEEELGTPEELISLSLPDGTVLDLTIPSREAPEETWMEEDQEYRNKADYDEEDDRAFSEELTLRLPSGMKVNITLNRGGGHPPLRETSKPNPPRIGIAENDTDEEELGDPEGLIALLPSGTKVAITRTMARMAPSKPPRIGIAEDDTDEEELGDPEGIIAILPTGTIIETGHRY